MPNCTRLGCSVTEWGRTEYCRLDEWGRTEGRDRGRPLMQNQRLAAVTVGVRNDSESEVFSAAWCDCVESFQ